MPTPSVPAARASLPVGAIVFAVLALLVAIALGAQRPPAPAPANAAPELFSAGRALPKLFTLAKQPHPVGTAANAEARAWLIAELRALGLEPQVQSTLGVLKARGLMVGMVHNVMVRKPGSAPDRASRKALMLASHYDSVPHAPGAGDDGASVVAILETLRALQHGPALKNDLIALFTDGEEAGLLGAEAFVAEHPWAREVGLALNFEYRGNRGPMLMFETSVGNGAMVAGLAGAVSQPLASSLNYEVYKLMPNDTDMSSFKRAGIPGMNFAAIEGINSYHTALDRPDLFDPASLQHQGDIMLGLARHFGERDLATLRSADHAYFDLPGLGLLHYPAAAVLPLSVAVALLFIGVCVLGVRRGELRTMRVALGALLFLLLAALLAGAAHLLWMGLLLAQPGYRLTGAPYGGHWYLMAFAALVVGAYVWCQQGLQRWVKPLELGMGGMLIGLILLLAASVLIPGASVLLVWPLLAMLLATGALWLGPPREGAARTMILLLGAVPAVLMFVPTIRGVFIGLGPNLIAVMALVLVLLLGIATGLLAELGRRLPIAALGAGVVLLALGAISSRFDAEQPQPTNLFYVKDGAAGRSVWISTDETLNTWTAQYFPGVKGRAHLPAVFGPGGAPVWFSPAPEHGVSAPQVKVLSDEREGSVRKLEIEVASLRAAPAIRINVEGATVLRSRLNGKVLSDKPSAKWTLGASGIGPQGLRLVFELKPNTPFKIRVRERSFGLPSDAMRARPPELMAEPFGSADSTQSVTVLALD
ncbi:MAG: M20/M25/M40 family metallo-hydrolase [Pseudomonadota bacterium]